VKVIVPFKLTFFHKKFKDASFNLLDVGCGNHSPSIAKYWFPRCRYYGLDRDPHYNNDSRDTGLMDGFYQIDLVEDTLDEVPNEFFDLVIMAHIIEHLPNGEDVIKGLLPKLRKNGYMYLEYPSFRSTRLPSMRGTLNFFDDPTHCRLYSQMDLYNLFMVNGCKIVKGGTRRRALFIVLMPLRVIHDLVRHRYVSGSAFWDLMGFAEYIVVQK